MSTTPENNLIGFYASFNTDESSQKNVMDYLWGENGLNSKLKTIKWLSYGEDFHLVLFEFYVNPIPYERNALREIGNYRRKEKSIGIPIILDEVFFQLDEIDRQTFLKTIILNKLDLLKEKIKRNKLDLNIISLKQNVELLLS